MATEKKRSRYVVAAKIWAIMSTILLPVVAVLLFRAQVSLLEGIGVVVALYVIPQVLSWLNIRRLIKGAVKESMKQVF